MKQAHNQQLIAESEAYMKTDISFKLITISIISILLLISSLLLHKAIITFTMPIGATIKLSFMFALMPIINTLSMDFSGSFLFKANELKRMLRPFTLLYARILVAFLLNFTYIFYYLRIVYPNEAISERLVRLTAIVLS